jgi:hypothetical protein
MPNFTPYDYDSDFFRERKRGFRGQRRQIFAEQRLWMRAEAWALVSLLETPDLSSDTEVEERLQLELSRRP